ncbi:SDR family oxidoreductase [Brachybacterium sp. YJGR34]|uniref:SDR family oxidoreductase n=1 Tax=Brachybacterium sp. YJGR34 TaxID=2059911 RepID=UPI000E0AE50C|nr:SDR family oxidoreductase [Brachybacterium sp. YJGR34]
MSEVLVVIGVGGMGEAIARRLGAGRTVVLADFDVPALDRVAEALRGDGFAVHTEQVDVSSRESVQALARAAAARGPVTQVAHTAGLSPVQAPLEAVIAVDLVGVALVLDEFAEVIAPGGAGVVIASMAGTQASDSLPAEVEHDLATTPTDELRALPAIAGLDHAGHAYAIAKRAAQLRVRTASLAWGRRSARITSLSPGVISTPMGQAELAGDSGASMRAAVEASGTGRLGTSADIAAAAAFLLGPEATFITGTDLLVDGGVIAAVRAGAATLGG